MKKLLLLSLLVLFGCSKDSNPGDEIIGVHQIIYTSSADIDSPSRQLISLTTDYGPNDVYSGGGNLYITSGTIEFSSNNKGVASYTYVFNDGYGGGLDIKTGIQGRVYTWETESGLINFDWTYENNRWNLITDKNRSFQVSYFNNTYHLVRDNLSYYFR
jgi:hypothetical protein